jgi:hypothetical protein
MELDLSHNLFAEFRVVVEICKDLPDLRSLRLRYVPSAMPSPLAAVLQSLTGSSVQWQSIPRLDRRSWPRRGYRCFHGGEGVGVGRNFLELG